MQKHCKVKKNKQNTNPVNTCNKNMLHIQSTQQNCSVNRNRIGLSPKKSPAKSLNLTERLQVATVVFKA